MGRHFLKRQPQVLVIIWTVQWTLWLLHCGQSGFCYILLMSAGWFCLCQEAAETLLQILLRGSSLCVLSALAGLLR